MSVATSPTLSPPLRRPPSTPDLAEQLIVAFATAADVPAGMAAVVALLAERGGADRVEWWAPSETCDALELTAATGMGGAHRTPVPLGPVGALVLAGPRWSPRSVDAAVRLVPVLRRRWTEERLARHATLLARRIEALDDFAALVAHELKGPLHASLLAEEPERGVKAALEIVESLLEVAQSERDTPGPAAPAICLAAAVRDLGDPDVQVAAQLPDSFPLPAQAQRLVLRNLVSNAVAAGASHVRVSAVMTPTRASLLVDDDGVGLGDHDDYVSGSGLGFALCSRLIARFDGTLELRPRAAGGTRAALEVPWR
jgi:signal transduction histidine kinase